MSVNKSFELDNSLRYSLHGFSLANPSVTLIEREKILFRKLTKESVALVSGGGSGHEPAHSGFVGEGMLAAAVAGDIFASPSTAQILSAIRIAAKQAAGVLLIVKNYTGDVLHFGLAAERARSMGIDCRVVIVGDDVAVGRTKGAGVGRRGLAGTVLVHKIAGEFARRYSAEYGVEEVAKVAEVVNDNLVTIGASLSHCKVPGREFESGLTDSQMELGMGIHNEPGVQVLEPIPPTDQLIQEHMLPMLLSKDDKERYYVDFSPDDEVILLVNNLGGVSNYMLTAITAKVTESLDKYGIRPVRTIYGSLMTAFNGNGFSITLLNVTRSRISLEEMFESPPSVLDLFDASTSAPAWPRTDSGTDAHACSETDLVLDTPTATPAGHFDYELFAALVKAGSKQVRESEPHITHLDNIVGDGDCGTTLVAGAQSIEDALEQLRGLSFSETIGQASQIIEASMGGTSGALYSILLSGISHEIAGICNSPDEEVTLKLFATALQRALRALYKYSRARPGDCTMIDALEPFVSSLYQERDFFKAVEAAEEGARATAKMAAKFGRASYVSDTTDVPDPGAVGFVAFLRGMRAAFEKWN
ncbi:AaceriAER139Cp [[Ashbya] aceris (nom. inval.)]|nr:AaceriAER139Cp [[Ashbya] aceris (nom. inval.)]